MKINLAAYHGGLGDNLQFSTLPELYFNRGDDVRIYVGQSVKPFRNKQIRDLVWGTNPYISNCESYGESWNAGDTEAFKYENCTGHFIHNIEKLHGFEPANKFPKIYHCPYSVRGVDALIELSGISLKYDEANVIKTVQSIISSRPEWQFKQVVSPQQSNRIIIPGVEIIKCDNLFYLFDLIASSKFFVSLNSGTHSLAAAATRFRDVAFGTLCILPDNDFDWIVEQRKFMYPQCGYMKESDDVLDKTKIFKLQVDGTYIYQTNPLMQN